MNLIYKIKNYFNDWNLFEMIFIFTFEILFIILGIIFNQPFISSLYSTTVLLCVFFLAKGKWYGYVFGLIGTLSYCYIALSQDYYGECLYNLVVTFPLYVVSIVCWFNNQLNKVVKIRKKLEKREIFIFILENIGLFVLMNLFLYSTNSPQWLTSSFAITFSFTADYLAMRRSDFTFIAYCFNDIFLIILWIIPLLNGEISLLNVSVTMFAFLINDIYGVINWRKIKRIQNTQI